MIAAASEVGVVALSTTMLRAVNGLAIARSAGEVGSPVRQMNQGAAGAAHLRG